MSAREIDVLVAMPGHAEAVNALLRASYPPLLASGYEPDLLARALPVMTSANPALLKSGTWYVAAGSEAPGLLVGCGGWTRERPHAPDAPLDPALAHIRHFATHPGWTGRGVGRALFERCLTEAQRAGVSAFECYSTLVAEGFYRKLGFKTVEDMLVPMGPGLSLPAIRMRLDF